MGLQDRLLLGNLSSLRDWGYAPDYVACMWMILQHDTPDDFVIATGEQHTVLFSLRPCFLFSSLSRKPLALLRAAPSCAMAAECFCKQAFLAHVGRSRLHPQVPSIAA